jgi:elongation factor 1-gamma
MNHTLTDITSKLDSLQGGSYGDKVAKIKEIIDYFTIVDGHFVHHTFVAGNTFTVADILLAITLLPAFTSFFATTAQGMLPNLTRFFMTVVNQPLVASVIGKVELSTKDVYMELAKAFVAPTDDKPAAKPKKEVNSLDTLPKSTMKIDDVKREWSLQRPFNPNFGEWLWANFDAEGWSLWEVSYKYPEDWDKDYAADNQLVGFINRCECVKKYAFAVLNLYKMNDECYNAKGAFVLRGTEIPSLMEDVSDFEEYNFTKIDASTPEGKAKFLSLICANDIDGKEILFRRALK